MPIGTRLPPLAAKKIILSRAVPTRTKPYTAFVVGVSDRRTQKEVVPVSRTLVALAFLVLAVLGVVVLLPECAYACSCALPPGDQKVRAERALSGSEAVFSGEVVDFEKSAPPTTMMEGTMWTIMGGGTATATLRVSEVWKGPKQRTVEVTTGADSGMGCGYPFEDGREYLVYAGKGISVDLCSETKPLAKARADLAVLGNGEKPKYGGDALSDTSGGFSVGAMVGIAGFAMAVSAFVMVRLMRSS